MNWDQLSGAWMQFRGKVREQWGRLTEDDLDIIDGQREQLEGKLQERYGVAREDASRAIDSWLVLMGGSR
jgi:uncharacterized protein YjbJ (UPF0337 family)